MERGTQLGPYRILQPIGAGGMGEVYLAEDPRLDRRVAIKVLPDEFAADPGRLERFRREAKSAAALNHPHIATIHDVGVEDGTYYIVQEYLQGETLGEAMSRGAFPIRRTLTLMQEVAAALATAHEAGIVHRDLKPDNVFLTRDGHAKVLDFGLAVEVRPRRGIGSDPESLSRSPTTASPTGERLVGSVGYMAPEQVEGRPLDARTDMFALGCVLYELLAGAHPFRGRSAHQTLDRILHEDPRPLREHDAELSPRLQWIVDKCLAKDADERYQDARDLVVDLRHAARALRSGEPTGPAPAGDAVAGRPGLAWLAGAAVVAALLAGWLGAWIGGSPGPVSERTSRFFVNLPTGTELVLSDMRPLAISGDGARMAYVALQGGTTQIYLRGRDDFEARPVPGTEGGNNPFFSPDGEWLGFFSAGKLRKVAVGGGVPRVLCDTSFQPRGASWGDDGRIVFASSGGSGLSVVPAEGGEPRPLTTPDGAAGEVSHRWPRRLPAGQGTLFVVGSADIASYDDATVMALGPGGEAARPLVQGTDPAYVPTGHLLFSRAGAVLAVPFDPATLEVTGTPVPVVEQVATRPSSGAGYWAVSDGGTLVYVAGLGVASRALVWVDRQGVETPVAFGRRAYDSPRLSPDDRRIAVTIHPEGGTPDIWVLDLDRGTTNRLTYEGMNGFPVWTADGDRIAFTSNRSGPFNLFWKPADGSRPAEALVTAPNPLYPDSFSPEGLLAYSEDHPDTVSDIWLVDPAAGAGRGEPVLQLPFTESGARFSPDGRWLAYVSDETGRDEVYVRSVDGSGRWRISTDGGTEPVWGRDRAEIHYRNGGDVLAVPLRVDGDGPSPGTPEVLFQGPYGPGVGSANYDVAADGRFLMIRSEAASAPTLVNVVVDWFGELRAAVPVDG